MVGSGPTPGAFDNAGWLRQSGEGHARLPFAVINRGTLENTDTTDCVWIDCPGLTRGGLDHTVTPIG